MITRDEAIALGNEWGARTLYHATMRNRDGSALRARVNGKCKTWKRSPERFQLPIKHGLRDCGYLTEANAHEWLTFDPTTEEGRRAERDAKETARLAKRLNLSADCPAGIVRDAAIDAGLITQ